MDLPWRLLDDSQRGTRVIDPLRPIRAKKTVFALA